jgi:hypothetical protein
MFIPDFDPDTKSSPVEFRVPILPFTQASEAVKEELTEAETPVRLMLVIYGLECNC